MVLFSDRANNDLDEILQGMLNWEKMTLTFEHISNYISDIIDVCDKLDQTNYHTNSKYQIHKQFGNKVYKYRRNRNTTWYILYDYNKQNNIVYIKHIISNHTTIAGT
jgi:hypothetical protein